MPIVLLVVLWIAPLNTNNAALCDQLWTYKRAPAQPPAVDVTEARKAKGLVGYPECALRGDCLRVRAARRMGPRPLGCRPGLAAAATTAPAGAC